LIGAKRREFHFSAADCTARCNGYTVLRFDSSPLTPEYTVALNRVACPECGAGLKSPTGFNVGQTVCCPKCESYFVVEKPEESDGEVGKKKPLKASSSRDDDDDYDQPKKKRKNRDEDVSSYKNSPIRYIILGVLIIAMCVLGYMLYEKKQREGRDTADSGGDHPQPVIPPPPTIGIPPPPKLGGGVGLPKLPNPRLPNPKLPNPSPPTGGGGLPGIPGLSSSGTVLPPAETFALVTKFKKQIVGSWKADLGDGKSSTIEYLADGTFTDTLDVGGKPTTVKGTWAAGALAAGNKGFQINRTVNGTKTQVKAIFEDDEMLHDTQEKGTLGAFKKQ
jgi:uncharacterized Zn finger protein (UPF0148 family)